MKHDHLDYHARLRASYGLAHNSEWRSCAECAAAVDGMSAARRESNVEASMSEWFWTRQRQAVVAEIGGTARPRLAWRIAGLAIAVVAAMVLIAPFPGARVTSPIVSAEDERLFEEVSNNVTRVTPRALSPLDPVLGEQQ
jgi:hypothetical protein